MSPHYPSTVASIPLPITADASIKPHIPRLGIWGFGIAFPPDELHFLPPQSRPARCIARSPRFGSFRQIHDCRSCIWLSATGYTSGLGIGGALSWGYLPSWGEIPSFGNGQGQNAGDITSIHNAYFCLLIALCRYFLLTYVY